MFWVLRILLQETLELLIGRIMLALTRQAASLMRDRLVAAA